MILVRDRVWPRVVAPWLALATGWAIGFVSLCGMLGGVPWAETTVYGAPLAWALGFGLGVWSPARSHGHRMAGIVAAAVNAVCLALSATLLWRW